MSESEYKRDGTHQNMPDDMPENDVRLRIWEGITQSKYCNLISFTLKALGTLLVGMKKQMKQISFG